MKYNIDIIMIDNIPYLGICNKDNHRWLLTPSDDLPKEVVDEEVLSVYNSTFTQEVRDKYQELLDSRKPSSEQQEKDRVIAIKNKCSAIIYGRYSVPKQTNVLLGLEEESYGNTMKAFITAMRQQCKELIADPTKTHQDYIIPEEEK